VMKGLIVPVLEETMKILPVVAVAALVARRAPRTLNPSDWLLVGGMSGAGFDIVEKLFYTNNFQFTYGPHIGRFYLFTDALGISLGRGDSWTGFIGHGAATAFVAMGIGLGLHLKRSKSPIAQWWWAVPLVAFAWVTYEHALWNLRLASSLAVALTPAPLTPWLFVLLAFAVIVFDAFRLRRVLAASPVLRRWWRFVGGAGARSASTGQVVLGTFRLLRLSNAVAWYAAGEPIPSAAAPQAQTGVPS
jgi:RsiW-degrading membrane proteinase PrsW (M82 family)